MAPSADAPIPPTELLLRASVGDDAAMAALFPAVYDELHRLAHRQRRREPAAATLDTTALVHEAYLKLIDQTRVEWQNRAHFLAIAATAMRRILIDRARQRRSEKRGGRLQRVPLEAMALAAEDRAEVLIALDEALARLSEFSQRQARVVECRFFGGLSEAETAEALGVGVRTVQREWAKAKSWLYREVYPEHTG